MNSPVRTIKPKPAQKPNRLALSLLAVAVYAVAVTPLAYEEARRQVILWASTQPDMPLGGGYTVADREDIETATKAAGIALTTKERGKK